MNVASNILSLLGGEWRLQKLTGAYNFLDLKDGLQFRLGAKARNKINLILIKPTSNDAYTITFKNWKHEKNELVEVSKIEDVNPHQLRTVVADITGIPM